MHQVLDHEPRSLGSKRRLSLSRASRGDSLCTVRVNQVLINPASVLIVSKVPEPDEAAAAMMAAFCTLPDSAHFRVLFTSGFCSLPLPVCRHGAWFETLGKEQRSVTSVVRVCVVNMGAHDSLVCASS